MFWIYILKCPDESFYTGHTDNLELRLSQHEQGYFPDCYTFLRRPLQLVYLQEFPTRDEAFHMERRIKGWNRAKKTALIEGDWNEVSRIANFKYGQMRCRGEN
jgi:putative endonuclease